jgi:glucose-1-phosphate cytidylyltransferase
VKAVILAGGLGTRMGPETASRPKALVEVGGRPIIWHILKIYEAHGITDFVICAGFAAAQLLDHFAGARYDGWRVQVVDTGERTATGGRLRRVREVVGNDTFCMTYSDGVADIDISKLVAFHRQHGLMATVTAVEPRLPFGVVRFQDGSAAVSFEEKPRMSGLWVNSGFFVLEPRALNYIERDDESWEEGPLSRLASIGQLAAFRHDRFWQCMDAPRDRDLLEQLWRGGYAPWKTSWRT